MKITDTMDLGQLRERMGADATIAQAEEMRGLLMDLYPGYDSADVDEIDWNGMLEAVS